MTHDIHEGAHDHTHGPDCGHTAVKHDGHVDYLHDGHMHHPHGDHVDEHTVAVDANNQPQFSLMDRVVNTSLVLTGNYH